MGSIRLTVGMPTHSDYQGVWMTVQGLRLLHPDLTRHLEILVADQAPDSGHGRETRGLLARVRPAFARVSYLPCADTPGSGAAKDRVFRAASGDAVLCLDSHVLLLPGSVQALLDYLEANPDSRDLLHGVMVHDDFLTASTHLDEVWSSEQWGQWQSAFVCPCGRFWEVKRLPHAVMLRDPGPKREYQKVCVDCGREPAEMLPWGAADGVPQRPYEIWAHGTGLIACRKDAWLGFPGVTRGFGAEEVLLQAWYRKHGCKTWCLPRLRWLHRFGHPDGVRYRLDRLDKVRNFVSGFHALGWDTKPVYRHFVSLDAYGEDLQTHLAREHGMDYAALAGKSQEQLHALHRRCKLTQGQWQDVIKEAAVRVEAPTAETAPVVRDVRIVGMRTGGELADWYARLEQGPNGQSGHLQTLSRLASLCRSVTELPGVVGVSAVALLHGVRQSGGRLLSVAEKPPAELERLERLGGVAYEYRTGVSPLVDIEPADLLFLNAATRGVHLLAELERYRDRVERFIVIRGTADFGEVGSDNQPGLLVALRLFLKQHPEWFVVEHGDAGGGLTVLGMQEQDRPLAPAALPEGSDQLVIPPAKPLYGPGSELKAMLSQIGVNPAPSCDCNARSAQMDAWGVEGCKANRDTIIGWLRDGQGRWGWKDKLAMTAKAVTSGLAFKLNPLDPLASLVDEAIRRAEAKEGKA